LNWQLFCVRMTGSYVLVEEIWGDGLQQGHWNNQWLRHDPVARRILFRSVASTL